MTREEALAVLRSGAFEAFIGVEEDLEVEFKGEPYQLDHDAEKFELAKDASALGNASGGVIVIGVRTERHAESPADVARELRPFTPDLIDEGRYLDVIVDRIYPRIDAVSVKFHAAEGAERGLVVIDVPPQDPRHKYFLVHRPVGGEGRTPGWLVGVAVRSIGRVDEQRIGELHALVNNGLTVSRQISDVAASVASIHEVLGGQVVEQEETPADRLQGVVDARIAELGD